MSGGGPRIHHHRSGISSKTLQVCLAATLRKREQDEDGKLRKPGGKRLISIILEEVGR